MTKTIERASLSKTRSRSQQRRVSLSGYAVPDDAKRKLVDIWLGHDGNDAKQILEAFKLGFNAGATAQAND